jgi:hypothetical protein
MLERLLANASGHEGEARRVEAGDLTYVEARALIARLKEAGVQPAPTSGQMEYMVELIADLGMSEDELEALTGIRAADQVRDSVQASGVLDELRRVFEERRPPSAKQRRFVEDLVRQSGLPDADAAALVGLRSLDELTGGAEGTASQLIDRLQEREAAGTSAT